MPAKDIYCFDKKQNIANDFVKTLSFFSKHFIFQCNDVLVIFNIWISIVSNAFKTHGPIVKKNI